MGNSLVIEYNPDRLRKDGEFLLEISPNLTLEVSGVHVISQEAWEEALAHPIKGQILDDVQNQGGIRILANCDQDATALKQITSDSKAAMVVRNTFNPELLKSWKATEDRPSVIAAIDKQMQELHTRSLADKAKEEKAKKRAEVA